MGYKPTLKSLGIIGIYDGPETLDRYTVLLNIDAKPGFHQCLCLSEHLGINMFGDCEKGCKPGKRIAFKSLPEQVRKAIIDRLS